jgi:hypothetical protein
MEAIKLMTIKKELLVQASQRTAFEVFTEQMNSWWPREYHVGKCPMTELVLEPGVNGRWYSRHEDGSECMVGHVLTWDPYGLLVLNWQLGADFQFHPKLVTEVNVEFIPQGAATLVKMEHRHLDRMGDGPKAVNEMDGGWGRILQFYKTVAEHEA